ncbi:MAG: hypothetical protein QOD99_2800 [Chthoniobacter sp.]|jgi:catalase|nr:hypothetical protein [Chthoniobacter sp.]
MDRGFRRLALAAACAGATALAQEPSAAPSAKPSVSPALKPWAQPKKPDEFEDARRIFEKLSPAERQRFRENLQLWKNLPPAEQAALRDQEQTRRAKIAAEIDESVRKSGLQLDEDRRQVYALRYAQERRKIERQLRQEMETKRGPMMQNMLARLKSEFNLPAPSPTPVSTP